MSTTTTSISQTKSHGDSNFGKGSSSSTSVERSEGHGSPYPEAAFELNSHVSLPYDWVQCLDSETGEIIYINWRNGEKAESDPKERVEEVVYWEEYIFSEDDSSYADSEDLMSESSLCSSAATRDGNKHDVDGDDVLVVVGCRICFMYLMVSKQDSNCPICNGQLLHL